MKIAIFTPYNIFKSGGVQEHVTSQARILRKRGHSVTIMTPKPRRKLRSEVPDGVVFVGASARIKAPSATSADVSVTLDNDAVETELSKNYDVIHVHEPLVPIAARQILSKAKGSALRVGTFHAALPGNVLGKSLVTTYKTYARSVLPHVDVITAVSPAAIGFINDYVKIPINFIPNGINPSVYKSRKVERDRNLILFLGRLEKRKGVKEALKAFIELKKIKFDAKLAIAGDGPLRRSLQKLVYDKEIKDVEFLGRVTDNEKLDLLSRCSVYTSPALYGESFGIVLVEAMAMQAPIVAHKNEGYVWVLKDTGRLSIVNCKDSEAYAKRLQLMMEDDDLRGVWQKWAKDYVKQFDYEKIVDQYEALYKQHLK